MTPKALFPNVGPPSDDHPEVLFDVEFYYNPQNPGHTGEPELERLWGVQRRKTYAGACKLAEALEYPMGGPVITRAIVVLRVPLSTVERPPEPETDHQHKRRTIKDTRDL